MEGTPVLPNPIWQCCLSPELRLRTPWKLSSVSSCLSWTNYSLFIFPDKRTKRSREPPRQDPGATRRLEKEGFAREKGEDKWWEESLLVEGSERGLNLSKVRPLSRILCPTFFHQLDHLLIRDNVVQWGSEERRPFLDSLNDLWEERESNLFPIYIILLPLKIDKLNGSSGPKENIELERSHRNFKREGKGVLVPGQAASKHVPKMFAVIFPSPVALPVGRRSRTTPGGSSSSLTFLFITNAFHFPQSLLDEQGILVTTRVSKTPLKIGSWEGNCLLSRQTS